MGRECHPSRMLTQTSVIRCCFLLYGYNSYRATNVQGFMRRVKAKGIPVLVCDPTMTDDEFFEAEVTHDLGRFKQRANVIVASRWGD